MFKKLINLIVVFSFVSIVYAGISSGGDNSYLDLTALKDKNIIETVTIKQIEKTVDKPVFVNTEVKVPKFVEYEVKEPKFIPCEIKDVTVVPQTKYIDVPEFRYIKTDINLPQLDKEKLKEEIKSLVSEVLQEIDIAGLIKTKINEATKNLELTNVNVTYQDKIFDVPKVNYIDKTYEIPKITFVKTEVAQPVIVKQEQVIKVKKLILQDGTEIQ